MRDPQNEYDVELYADIEVNCRGARCGLEATFTDAFLIGDQWSLAFLWKCPNCGRENIEEYDTDKYIG